MSEFEKAFEKLVYTAVDKALQKHIENLSPGHLSLFYPLKQNILID